MWSQAEYDDFIMDLEYKIDSECNSGVFIRVTSPRSYLETQICDSHGKEGALEDDDCGALFGLAAPSKNTAKPAGEWNKCRITCQDNLINVVLNGEQITDMDVDRWSIAGKNPDEKSNKFKDKAIKDFSRIGHIGLQDHGREVWYRNIRIKRI